MENGRDKREHTIDSEFIDVAHKKGYMIRDMIV